MKKSRNNIPQQDLCRRGNGQRHGTVLCTFRIRTRTGEQAHECLTWPFWCIEKRCTVRKRKRMLPYEVYIALSVEVDNDIMA